MIFLSYALDFQSTNKYLKNGAFWTTFFLKDTTWDQTDCFHTSHNKLSMC